MKNFLNKMSRILMLSWMIILLSACSIKGEYNLKINLDKSIDVSVTSGFDDEFLETVMAMDGEGTDKEFTEDEKWEFIDSMLNDDDGEGYESLGFTKEKYQDDKYKGYKLVKKIKNIDTISGDNINFELDDFGHISEKTVFVKDGNSYKSKIYMSAPDEVEGSDVDVDLKFIVSLPSKPISHNADEVSKDGKTLTWNLAGSDVKAIEYEFKFPTFMPIIIGVFVLIALSAGGVFVFQYVKKHKKINPPTVFDNTGSTVVDNRPVESKLTNMDKPIESLEDCGIVVNPNTKMDGNHEVLDVSLPQPVNAEKPINFVSEVVVNNNQENKFFADNKEEIRKIFAKPEVTVEDMFPTERSEEVQKEYDELEKTVLITDLVTQVKQKEEEEKTNKFFNK